MESSLRDLSRTGGRLILMSVIGNAVLTVVKISAGVWGNSNALLADGLESALDILSSALIWGALHYAGKPPDDDHPYGHGKLESLAAVVTAIFLIGAGLSVAAHSGMEIFAQFTSRGLAPERHMPEAWTLVVLLGVIATKELFYRRLMRASRELGSSAIQSEAWHHRSDALTSVAAFLGISIALIGGRGWESADDWAALFSCVLILRNGYVLLRRSVGEVIDERVSPEFPARLERLACEVEGVSSAEKCRVRKSGLSFLADLHIRVSGRLTVQEGHQISHEVKDHLMAAGLHLSDVTVHLEPEDC